MSLIEFSLDSFGVACLTLNRPEKMNAFSRALCQEYLATLTEVEAKIAKGNLRVLIIKSSSDKAFCAGADLKEREAMSVEQINEQLKIQRQMMDRTAQLSVPTIAVIEGIAFGGGLELALCCDLRIASLNAQMGLTELRLGIIPGSGGTQRLARLVGLARARELIHLAKRIDATRAESIGLVNVTTLNVPEALQEYIEAILATGPLAQQAAKRAINLGYDMPLNEALNHERSCYETVLHSQDRIDGMQAFLEKRNPKYRGI